MRLNGHATGRALIAASALLLALSFSTAIASAAPKRPSVSIVVFDISKDCGVNSFDVEGRLRRVLREADIDALRGGSNYSLFVEIQAMPLASAPGCAGRLGLRFTEGSLRKSQFLPGGKRVQILLWESGAMLQSQDKFNEEAMATIERQARDFVAWFHDPK